MLTPSRFLLFFLLLKTPLAPARAEEINDAFQRVKSSVVVIEAQENGGVTASSATLGAPPPSEGSGVVVSDEKKIMTSAGMVQAADWVEVRFEGGQETSARVLSSTLLADIAVLELEKVPTDIKGVSLGNSDRVNAGDSIFAVAVSSGAEPRLLLGHVVGRWKPEHVMENLIQNEFFEIDLPLSERDSGAPVFNSHGEVIGIVSNAMSKAGGHKGMGFAVPSNLAKNLGLKEPSFWSGLTGRLVSSPEKGLLVERVSSTSPAAKFGLRGSNKTETIDGKPRLVGGDIVLSVDGISFTDEDGLNRIGNHLRHLAKGEVVRIKILRDGAAMTLSSAYDQ